MSFHHNLRIRQIGEVEGAAAMVGVSVRVNQVIEPKAVIGGNRDIAAGVFFQRIEQYCVPSAHRPADRFCTYPGSILGKT